ncbi:fructosamine kinase [Amycolatopsis balhimycina DSM 5908]|uniref:Fructosamine kinase n=1 Tax=Amycolatopsis balhimycina DSM 5908 TaxID=1081091 RepID=A0A428WC88_AMYBA|nr:fructosamine kinase family protein [Amycolatopsis balhimycina]RSM40584.1 fructosamine kinase [Amycolatopsis balhimycina DSM 5908]
MSEPATRLTGHAVTGTRRLSGDLTEAVLDDGRVVVVKRGHGTGATAAEAAGLRWLASAAAVPVPSVHGQDEDWLVIDRVPEGRPTAAAAERLGHGLARLHAAGAPAFGAAPPGGPAEAWIGRAPMANATGEDWATWYAEHRVLPYVREAADAGTFGPAEVTLFERACGRLPALAEPPSRLHGDLWNGNVLWDGRDAWLIDPAAHGGHRETDLAMLHLFGCPHLDRVVAAYQEVSPLADGWAERIGAHQLFPLLVHSVLFGQSYAGQAVAAARSLR